MPPLKTNNLILLPLKIHNRFIESHKYNFSSSSDEQHTWTIIYGFPSFLRSN